MEIPFAAEVLFKVGPLPITNSLFTTFLVSLSLIVFSLAVSKNIKLMPTGFQNFAEMLIEGFYNFASQIAGKKASFIFPWFMTFFLFIIVGNWMGLMPGFGTIGFFPEESHAAETSASPHLIPLLRSINSDLNMTLALALISIFITHFYSIKLLGIKEYLSRFFSFNPINLFVGILELVGEFTKVASLSFRLFGNVFAGEALLHTVAGLSKTKITAFILPLPFMILEIVVGFVQALVFSMLTLAFMVILTTSHNENH